MIQCTSVDVRWVKLRSWHVSSRWASRGGEWHTLCGRFVRGEEIDVRPSDEKSCETCLRILTKAA